MLLSLLALCVHAKVDTYPTHPIGACAPHCSDVESADCQQCCQTYDHETSWQCGTENAADCCTEWGPHCFWERGPHNFDHGCKDCGPPPCCDNGSILVKGQGDWFANSGVTEFVAKQIEGIFDSKDRNYNEGMYHAKIAWGVCNEAALSTTTKDSAYWCSRETIWHDNGMYFAYNHDTQECRVYDSTCTFETTPTPGFKLYMYARWGNQYWGAGKEYQLVLGYESQRSDNTAKWLIMTRATGGEDKTNAETILTAPGFAQSGGISTCPTDLDGTTWEWANGQATELSIVCHARITNWSPSQDCYQKKKRGSGVRTATTSQISEAYCSVECQNAGAECEVWEYNWKTNMCVLWKSGGGKTAAVIDARVKYMAATNACYAIMAED